MANLQQALAQEEITPQVERFRELLSARLQVENLGPYGVRLRTDYSPEAILLECWSLSCSDDGFGRFPIKTAMTIYKDHITVIDSEGRETLLS